MLTSLWNCLMGLKHCTPSINPLSELKLIFLMFYVQIPGPTNVF